MNDTKKDTEYSINITKSGDYKIKLVDNVSNDENVEPVDVIIKTANKPNTDKDFNLYDYIDSNLENSENWANVEEENIDYVWIPRFVYKYNSEEEKNDIKFLKGNSNIATDNTYVIIGNGENDWTLPDIFSTEDKELTGIWVIKSEGISFNDIIDETITDGVEEIKEEEI